MVRKAKSGEFRSTVYTNRPPYADFDAPQKFEAIKGIIARRLREHPNAMCSYSGGSDSDILLHLIEQVREVFALPPVHYYFFETGLEMAATRRHVKEQAERYGVEITTVRPKKNIVQATREYGQPFVSKIMSAGLEGLQKSRSRCRSTTSTTSRRTRLRSAPSSRPGIRAASRRSILCAAATLPGSRGRTSNSSLTAASTCWTLSGSTPSPFG